LPPLDPTLKAALGAVVPDPEPEALTRDTHYWICNEDALELFEPHVRGLGGALVGVGTDQNFIFAGWARSGIPWTTAPGLVLLTAAARLAAGPARGRGVSQRARGPPRTARAAIHYHRQA
jgi:hypothetical protein